MNKQEFLAQLRKGLSGLPQDDIEERLTFYSEMIEDRKEEGLSEEDAVLAVGSVDEIAAQITADIPPAKNLSVKRRFKAWEIVLLVLGSPIWLSLLIAVFAVAVSLYASLWVVVVSLWAAFVSVAVCAFSGAVVGIVFAFGSNRLPGIGLMGASVICAGFSVLLLFGCKWATKGLLLLTNKIFRRRWA